jgi:hypothetical protein
MGALVGFIIGYYMGTKDGRERLVELKQAVEEIRNSPEVQGIVANGVTEVTGLARGLLSEEGSLRQRLAGVAGDRAKEMLDRRVRPAA